jgi:excisionase family DNA binding protein
MSIQVGDMKLYDVEELAEMLDVGLPTIRRYLRQGRLKGKKLAKRWYVSEENLKDYSQPEEVSELQPEEAR